jgi:AraC-like DNA-binding protein
MSYLIGIFLSLFLSLILVSKKDKTQADWILSAWLLTISTHLFLFYLHLYTLHFQYPFLLGWLFPMPLLHWSFLYLYISSLTSKNKLNYAYLIHFLPFVFSVVLIFNYFFLPGTTKIEVYKNQGKGFETHSAINFIVIIVSVILYTTLCVIKVVNYKKTFKNEFSFTEKINLRWLQYLIVGMTILFLIILYGNDQYIYTSVTGFVLFIGYFGIKQVGVFNQNSPSEENFPIAEQTIAISEKISTDNQEHIIANEVTLETKKTKYEKSKISGGELNNIHQKLIELMNKEQLYKNPELTLSEVAQKIPTHANTLSQVINSVEEKNFYDYINLQRVEEFKRIVLLPKNKQYTLLTLAYESGFNSKTSFNRNFKKVTNLSPTEYLSHKNIHLEG